MARSPGNPGPNVTLLAAIAADGRVGELTLPGALDGLACATYVTRLLVPQLRPGQLVICDNLSAHKRRRARIWIEAAGCQLVFLPPYSPDFNPIELAFSKLQTDLRRAAPRSRAALDQAITAALATITSQDAQAWFTHCDYAASPQLF